MFKFLFVLTFFVGTIQNSFANDSSFDWVKINPSEKFEDFDWSVLPKGITKEMVLSVVSSPYVSGKDPITFLPIADKIYALLPCRFEVLVWRGEEWENLYKGYTAGFNCQAFFFVRNDVLYSYGKYGFWRAHSELVYFDFQSGYWENVKAKNTPIDYAGVLPFLIENKLVTIMGQYINQSAGIDDVEKNGFYFDFETGEWIPLKVKIPNQPDFSMWMNPTFDLRDFGFHSYKYQAEVGLVALNKKNLTLSFRKFDYTPVRDHTFSYSKGNKAWFFDKSSNLIYFDFENDLKTSFVPLGNIELLKEWPLAESSTGLDWKSWLIGFLVITLGFLNFNRLKSKKNVIIENEPINQLEEQQLDTEEIEQEVSLLIRLLSDQVNKSFEVEAFDHLLGIHTLDNLDYRRVKRNRLIKAVNESYIETFGKVLIERTRSGSDKRIIYYRIIG